MMETAASNYRRRTFLDMLSVDANIYLTLAKAHSRKNESIESELEQINNLGSNMLRLDYRDLDLCGKTY